MLDGGFCILSRYNGIFVLFTILYMTHERVHKILIYILWCIMKQTEELDFKIMYNKLPPASLTSFWQKIALILMPPFLFYCARHSGFMTSQLTYDDVTIASNDITVMTSQWWSLFIITRQLNDMQSGVFDHANHPLPRCFG